MTKQGDTPLDLLLRWTSVQLAQARQATYSDPSSLLVTAYSCSPNGHNPFDREAHDYDEPAASHMDPVSVTVTGVKHVAGIDIGYDAVDNTRAVVAMVVLTYPQLEVKHTFLRHVQVTQQYVPSFLSMRELEHVLAIYDIGVSSISHEDKPDVVFVDGFGRWHERQAGLATALGVERGIVTIGVGKEYQPLRPDLGLYEGKDVPVPMPPRPTSTHFRSKQQSFRERAKSLIPKRGDFLGVPLYRGGPLVGAAVQTAPGRSKGQTPLPIYVSPGNCITLKSAVALTMSCCTSRGSRIPTPVIVADRVGRDELKRWNEGRQGGRDYLTTE